MKIKTWEWQEHNDGTYSMYATKNGEWVTLADCKAALAAQQAKIERLRLRRYIVSVLPECGGDPIRKYTVECHGRDDAMLIAFALDGGWGRGEEVDADDASDMLELAKSYCTIEHEVEPFGRTAGR